MSGEKILVVDYETKSLNFLYHLLKSDGYEVLTAPDSMGAIRLMEENRFHAVFTEFELPDGNGVNLLKHIRGVEPHTIGIVFADQENILSWAKTMKSGAFHCLTKPLKIDEVSTLLRKVLPRQKAHNRSTEAASGSDMGFSFGEMIGQSDAIQKVFQLIRKIADTDSTVLIYGESGTGKELVARTLHSSGCRRKGPFVPVNCGAIPESLLESELFGHEKGAFTGANSTRPGRFELAHQGTIFLDEIGNMCPAMQVKVLRVLQERKFERLGGITSLESDVRVIAATNKNLEEAVKKGEFREDLFYRLDVIPILLPPLRERHGDLPLLAAHFLKKFNALRMRFVEGFSYEALDIMERYRWPGNVRELENVIDRMVVLKEEGIISPRDLPDKVRNVHTGSSFPVLEIPEEGLCLEAMMKNIEKELILKALEKSNWVKQRAAKLLNVNRTTLVGKIEKIGIKQDLPTGRH
jgi:DNA-binding NtrC family response regulator